MYIIYGIIVQLYKTDNAGPKIQRYMFMHMFEVKCLLQKNFLKDVLEL